MSRAQLTVAYAGPHVTLQDGGRRGMLRFGVPASGAMDRKALAIANVALGNDPAAPAIEISLGGLTLDCTTGPVTLAVAGGGFVVQVGAHKFGAWSVFTLHAGERLIVRPGPWGSWCYLAVAGNLVCDTWLGSAATHGSSGLGGGRLQPGLVLEIGTARHMAHALPRPIGCPPFARARHQLHVVPGPQDRFFATETQASFYGSPFAVSDAVDRMGMRLRGPLLPVVSALSIPSEPILRGSVQVSGDGVATVLMADHQTTGGYPKIATVLSDDLDGFAQLRPRDTVSFAAITAPQAIAMARQRKRNWLTYLSRLSMSCH